jgi:hypothetical protein
MVPIGDEITEDDIGGVLRAHGRRAMFVARHYGPPGEAEDVISDVVEYLLARRVYLSRSRSLTAYFLLAVQRTAQRRWR